MTKIFLSYRRTDSAPITRRIHMALEAQFGTGNVFIDADLGAGDWLKNVMTAVNNADACIVVIGPNWLNATNAKTGAIRLFEIGDVVRREVEQAWVRPLTVIMLVNGADVPDKSDLPVTIDYLPMMNAFVVRDDENLESDVLRVSRKITQFFDPSAATTVTASLAPVPPTPQPIHAAVNPVPALISQYFTLFDERKWDEARVLLATIRASGKVPKAFNIDNQEAELAAEIAAEAAALAAQYSDDERDQEYAVLCLRASRPKPHGIWESLQEFWKTYPGYDPENLARFQPKLPSKKSVVGVLPAPFSWITIPKPKSASDINASYLIAKYPVTNAQFRLFVEAGGYRNPDWWTHEGWLVKAQGWVYDEGWTASGKAWTEPRYWTDSKWNGADQPVVGISWYEAVAYCLWLSDHTGEKVMLLSANQWQHAAQGDGGQVYPWGNTWDATRCNHNVEHNGVAKTSSVRQYEGAHLGDSIFGVTDMVGNVWEWCATDYDSKTNDVHMISTRRVLRGGSWYNNYVGFFRCDLCGWYSPLLRNINVGFRLCLG